MGQISVKIPGHFSTEINTQRESTDRIKQSLKALANAQTEIHKQQKALGSLINKRAKETQSTQRRLLIVLVTFGIPQLGMLGMLIAFWIGAS